MSTIRNLAGAVLIPVLARKRKPTGETEADETALAEMAKAAHKQPSQFLPCQLRLP